MLWEDPHIYYMALSNLSHTHEIRVPLPVRSTRLVEHQSKVIEVIEEKIENEWPITK